MVFNSSDWVILSFCYFFFSYFSIIYFRPFLFLALIAIICFYCGIWYCYILLYWSGPLLSYEKLFWKFFHIVVGFFILGNLCFNLFQAIRISPGTPPETLQAHPSFRYCRKCNRFKPPGTYHCKVCGRCILMIDHHCRNSLL